MSLQFWYMFPLATVFATIAMASGVGGAIFFSPVFILILKLDPAVAIGTALITEVFGFASGLIGYARKKLIDYKLGGMLLMVSVPAALIGTYLAGTVSPLILKVIFGVGLVPLALSFLRSPDKFELKALNNSIKELAKEKKPKSCITSAEGEKICYTACNRGSGMLASGAGGFFMGLISAGLGEINSYFLLRQCRVPAKVSVATSVFVVAITALSASVGHLVHFVQSGPETIDQVLSLVIFTIPGVVIGGQLGTKLASRIPQKIMEKSLGVLFLMVAIITLGTAILVK